MFFLFLCGSRIAGRERRKKMAKFLSYEDRLKIQNGLKKHLIFPISKLKTGGGRYDKNCGV